MKIFGKTIIFTGSKGGCGQSFIANCIASYLAIKTRFNILMIDMNTGSRDSRAVFKMADEDIMTIADIYNKKKKPVIADIKKIIVNFNNSLSYIFPPLKQNNGIFNYGFLKNLFKLFANIFDIIIVDCNMFVDFNIKEGSIFDLSDELVIVSLPDEVSVFNLNSMLGYFLKSKENLDLKIIINKCNVRPAVPFFKLNSLVRYPINHLLPYDRDIEALYLLKGPADIFKYNLTLINSLTGIAKNMIKTIPDANNN
jgi:cellulose biosynthesis protein BcsQ